MEELLKVAKILSGGGREIHTSNSIEGFEWDKDGCTLYLSLEYILKIEANTWNNVFSILQVHKEFPLSIIKKQIDNVYFRAEDKRMEFKRNELNKTPNGKIYIETEKRIHAY